MFGGHSPHGDQRGFVTGEVVVNLPGREARALQRRRLPNCLIEKREPRSRRLRDQALDELLERRQRRMTALRR